MELTPFEQRFKDSTKSFIAESSKAQKISLAEAHAMSLSPSEEAYLRMISKQSDEMLDLEAFYQSRPSREEAEGWVRQLLVTEILEEDEQGNIIFSKFGREVLSFI